MKSFKRHILVDGGSANPLATFRKRNILQNTPQVFEMKAHLWGFVLPLVLIIWAIAYVLFQLGAEGIGEVVEIIKPLDLDFIKKIYYENQEIIIDWSKQWLIIWVIILLSIIMKIVSFFNQVAYIRIDQSQMITKSYFDVRLGRTGRVMLIAPPTELIQNTKGRNSKAVLKIIVKRLGDSETVKLRADSFGSYGIKELLAWLSKSQKTKPASVSQWL